MPIKPTRNEHFDRLYEFWLNLTGNGSRKQDALKFFERRSRRDDPERVANEIIIAIQRLDEKRKADQEKGEFVPSWCALAVYINQKRDMDDVPTKPKPQERKATFICYICNQKPGTWKTASGWVCSDCHSGNVQVSGPKTVNTYLENIRKRLR